MLCVKRSVNTGKQLDMVFANEIKVFAKLVLSWSFSLCNAAIVFEKQFINKFKAKKN